MTQAFRETLDPAAARVKSLEARLAQESQRGLQLEKQVEALSGSAARTVALVYDLEARLADQAERMLELEKQMQAFLGRTMHPIAQARDVEPRIAEPESPLAAVIRSVAVKIPRQTRRKA